MFLADPAASHPPTRKRDPLIRTLPFAITAVLALASAACGSRAEAPTCWVDYSLASADCSEEQFACQVEVEDNADQTTCNNVTERCWQGMGAELADCAGKRSCLATWWQCLDDCDKHYCMEPCWDAFFACADWYATGCENACRETMSSCVDEAQQDNVGDEILIVQGACLQAYYADCVPACYPDA